MRAHASKLIALALGTLVALTPLLMAPTGGFPSRPRFQAVTVGNGTVATGDVRARLNGGGGEPIHLLHRASGNPGVGIGIIQFHGQDSTAAEAAYARLQVEIDDPTSPAHSGRIDFEPVIAGSFVRTLRLDQTRATFDRPILINAPATGAALTVQSGPGPDTVHLNGRTTDQISSIYFNHSAGLATANYAQIQGHPTAGGLLDFHTNGVSRATLSASGTLAVTGAVTIAGLPAATQEAGSWVTGSSGCTTTLALTVNYVRVGSQVTLTIPSGACTSNATSFTLTGAPAAIRPANQTGFVSFYAGLNNGVTEYGPHAVAMQSDGTLRFQRNASNTGFTASGVKGLAAFVEVTYALD